MLWQWANNPMVRASAFNTGPISLENHTQWFEEKLHNPHCRIFIAENEAGIPVGQIRFDIESDGRAAIDLHVAPQQGGKGYGTMLLKNGLERFFSDTVTSCVYSYVKLGNDPSRKTFEKTGFTLEGQKIVRGEEVYYFTLCRP